MVHFNLINSQSVSFSLVSGGQTFAQSLAFLTRPDKPDKINNFPYILSIFSSIIFSNILVFLSPERTSIRAKSLDPSAHLPVAMHSQNRNIYSIHVSKSFKHLKL